MSKAQQLIDALVEGNDTEMGWTLPSTNFQSNVRQSIKTILAKYVKEAEDQMNGVYIASLLDRLATDIIHLLEK